MLRAMIVASMIATTAPAQQTVVVQGPDGNALEAQGTIIVRAADAPDSSAALPLQNGRAALALQAGKSYYVDLEAPGFWAISDYVVAEEHQEISLRAWRTANLHGTFAGTELPREMNAVTEAPPDAPKTLIPRGATFACKIKEDASFTCQIPAARMDLVLRPSGYAPVYLWAIELEPDEQRDLGSVKLQKGASLVAWLARESVEAHAKARLFREVSHEPSDERARLSVPVAEGVFNSRGHLQLVDLPAQPLTLEIRADGRATEWVGPLDIAPGRETVLRYPITLHPPIDLTVQVDPPLDPAGKRWSLTVRRRFTVDTPVPIPTVSAKADESGSAVLKGQSPGAFQITVSDGAGNRQALTQFALTHDSGAYQRIAIATYAVKGVLRQGGKPLAAELIFGGRSGDVSVHMTSSAEGTFTGSLPREGKWPLSVVADTVRADLQIDFVQGESLSVDVPAGQITGWVLDHEGQPVSEAEVRATWAGNHSASAVSDATGAFIVRGLAPGVDASVRASHRRTSRRSSSTTIPIADDGTSDEVRLTLLENRSGDGTVTASGAPVAGAVVTIQPVRGVSVTATTRIDGSFSYALPEGTRDVLVYVASPGKSFHAFNFAVLPEHLGLDVAPVGGDLEIVQPESRWTLTQNGVTIIVPLVLPWAQSINRTPVDPTLPVLTFPRMAPGQYTLCLAPAPGTLDVNGTCASGTLGPGTTLRLSVRQ